MRACLIATAVIAGCIGCGEPRVDTSSDESFKASIKEIRESLPPDMQDRFTESLQVVMLSGVESILDLADPSMEAEYMARLQGKTGEEIVALAQAIQQEQAERARQKKVEELRDLRDRILATREAQELISQFVVEESRFKVGRSVLDGPEIALTVLSQLEVPVTRVVFEGLLVTPGRAVPWVSESFAYRIPGGLEPGEIASWRLSPNQFGPWGNAPKEREDMVLTVRVTRLDGVSGEAIAEDDFSSDDASKMRTLIGELSDGESTEIAGVLSRWEAERSEHTAKQISIAVQRKTEYEERARAEDARARQERRKEQRRQIEREVAELRERKRLASEHETSRSAFHVERSRFYYRESGFLTEPVIEITVQNKTERAVSKVFFDGLLASPGREMPWVDERFSYEIPGGLAEGEGATWKLSPNMFSSWGKAPQDRDDLVLTLTVTKLLGAGDVELFPARFDEDDDARLGVLLSQLR